MPVCVDDCLMIELSLLKRGRIAIMRSMNITLCRCVTCNDKLLISFASALALLLFYFKYAITYLSKRVFSKRMLFKILLI